MADVVPDILMIVTGPEGQIRTDSKLGFSSLQGSSALTSGFFEGYIFELKEFSFAVGAGSSLAAAAAEKTAREQAARPVATAPGEPQPAAPPAPKPAPVTLATGKSDNPDMQPIDFTRLMDSASLLLMGALTACTTLTSISIVKRKASGTLNAGEAYLRLDFTDVLLTALDWKESNDVVEESGTFIYRQLKVQYRPQAADGTLGALTSVSWAMKS